MVSAAAQNHAAWLVGGKSPMEAETSRDFFPRNPRFLDFGQGDTRPRGGMLIQTPPEQVPQLMEDSMSCNQCEQAGSGTGCTGSGACGKDIMADLATVLA